MADGSIYSSSLVERDGNPRGVGGGGRVVLHPGSWRQENDKYFQTSIIRLSRPLGRSLSSSWPTSGRREYPMSLGSACVAASSIIEKENV